jgi:N-acetylmuramoyl-L-alanine amidase
MVIRNITLNIDDATYQHALTKARTEGKTIGQVLTSLLTQWTGPVPRPQPVTPTVPSPTPTATVSTYRVQAGDTLGGIARKVYGSAAKYPLIAKANNITDPRRIWVGQALTIPPVSGAATATTPSAPVTSAPTPTPVTAPVTSASPVSVDAPAIEWAGSPNFNARPTQNIWAIVIHSTANSTLEGVISWFNNPQAQVSAHYTIGKDGRIAQHVRDEDRAWHAGKSEWKGVPNVNNYGLGVELVNLNDGNDPYPEAQHQANVRLCVYLCRKHNIKPDNIMGHLDIAVPAGRKTDPRGYDLNRLRREVTASLGA